MGGALAGSWGAGAAFLRRGPHAGAWPTVLTRVRLLLPCTSQPLRCPPRPPPQVKVTLRIWPAQGARRSAESTSFLKVDPRKKQVTLYDPATGPPGSAGPRHATTAAVPKMFAFDAVFPQDSEQVRVAVAASGGGGAFLCRARAGGSGGGAERRPAGFPLPRWPPRPSWCLHPAPGVLLRPGFSEPMPHGSFPSGGLFPRDAPPRVPCVPCMRAAWSVPGVAARAL